MKKIDAHAHMRVGHPGSWRNFSITPQELICQMDEYEIEKTVICTLPNEETQKAVNEFPDRLIGTVWVIRMKEKRQLRKSMITSRITTLKGLNYNLLHMPLLPMNRSFIQSLKQLKT